MIYPSGESLKKVGSKYKLVLMAAQRAKQLRAGMKPLIETESTNPLTIAFEEIAAGEVFGEVPDVEEIDSKVLEDIAKSGETGIEEGEEEESASDGISASEQTEDDGGAYDRESEYGSEVSYDADGDEETY